MDINDTSIKISDAARERIAESIKHYMANARLLLRVDTVLPYRDHGKHDTYTGAFITAHQFELPPNGIELTAEEIEERAQVVFAPMREEGILPIICVYTVKDGDINNPRTTHRSASQYQARGFRGTVLRIAPPRVLFTNQGPHQKVLFIEDNAAKWVFGQLAAEARHEYDRLLAMEPEEVRKMEKRLTGSANAWAKRAHYRGRVDEHMKEVRRNVTALDDRLRAAGIDPDQGKAEQGVTVLERDGIRYHIRKGEVITREKRGPSLAWMLID